MGISWGGPTKLISSNGLFTSPLDKFCVAIRTFPIAALNLPTNSHPRNRRCETKVFLVSSACALRVSSKLALASWLVS